MDFFGLIKKCKMALLYFKLDKLYKSGRDQLTEVWRRILGTVCVICINLRKNAFDTIPYSKSSCLRFHTFLDC